MEEIAMSAIIEQAYKAVKTPEIQAIIQKLSEHGLGVFIPHQHENGVVRPLDPDTVQFESNLEVSFVARDDPRLKNSSIIAWTWNKDRARVSAACACNPDHFPGGCVWREDD